MDKRKQKLLATLAVVFGASFAVAQARAGILVYDGITYTLTDSTTGSALTNQFTLTISGINGPLDTEKGRKAMGLFLKGSWASLELLPDYAIYKFLEANSRTSSSYHIRYDAWTQRRLLEK